MDSNCRCEICDAHASWAHLCSNQHWHGLNGRPCWTMEDLPFALMQFKASQEKKKGAWKDCAEQWEGGFEMVVEDEGQFPTVEDEDDAKKDAGKTDEDGRPEGTSPIEDDGKEEVEMNALMAQWVLEEKNKS